MQSYKQDSTAIERLLLSGAVAILPAQFFFPLIGGLSIAFLVFGALGSYLIIFRYGTLSKMLFHPLFLAAYVFLGTGFFMEFVHGNPDYLQLSRIFFMFVGAILVASLCRDRRAFFSAMFGLVLSSLLMSVLLIYFIYSEFSGADFHDFSQATNFREQIYADNPMELIDLNLMDSFQRRVRW